MRRDTVRISARFAQGLALASLCAVAAACGSTSGAPTSPSASSSTAAGFGIDGSTLKAAAPRLVAPTNGSTAEATPALVAEPVVGRFASVTIASLRFQVSESAQFATLTDEGTAVANAAGIINYRVQRAQRPTAVVYWRARAELDGAFGPWSATGTFTVSGSTPPPPPPPTGGISRTPNPPAGQRLPLPDVRGLIAQWTAERPDLFPSQQCPQGLKYITNPWQNYIMDRLRQRDTRWGYNAKPTRTAADNGGVPVVAAGDEVLYNYGSSRDEGNTTEVYAVDILEQHCGTPRLTWRVFTGEEPVRWTGAGRF
jgi:hypothetical protein